MRIGHKPGRRTTILIDPAKQGQADAALCAKAIEALASHGVSALELWATGVVASLSLLELADKRGWGVNEEKLHAAAEFAASRVKLPALTLKPNLAVKLNSVDGDWFKIVAQEFEDMAELALAAIFGAEGKLEASFVAAAAIECAIVRQLRQLHGHEFKEAESLVVRLVRAGVPDAIAERLSEALNSALAEGQEGT